MSIPSLREVCNQDFHGFSPELAGNKLEDTQEVMVDQELLIQDNINMASRIT